MKKLIVNLANINVACRHRSEYMVVCGYADDLSLLCTCYDIKDMLNLCEQFANDNETLFNSSKSQPTYFSDNNDSIHVRKPIILQMNNDQWFHT